MVVKKNSFWNIDQHVSPEEGMSKTSASFSALFASIEQSDWPKVISRCTEVPEEAKIWAEHRASDGTFDLRRLPLHEVCVRKPPIEIVNALLEAYPLASGEEDHLGRLPLHNACNHGASESVVLRIIRSNPDAIDKRDTFDKTPLSAIQFSSNRERDAIIDDLNQGALFYHMQNYEEKWVADIDKKVSELELAHQSEIEIESRTEEICTTKYALEERITDLATKVEIAAKTRTTRAQAAENETHSLKAIIEDLEQSLSKARSEVLSVDEDLCAKIESVRQLEEKEAELTAKMEQTEAAHDLTIKNKKKYEEENASLQEQVRLKLAVETCLRAKIDELNAAISNVEVAHASVKEEKIRLESENADVHVKLEEKAGMVSELESLVHDLTGCVIDDHGVVETLSTTEKIEVAKAKVTKMTLEKTELEQNIEESDMTITSIERAAADAYLKSIGVVDELERKLADAAMIAGTQTAEHECEKQELESTIEDLRAKTDSNDSVLEEVQRERDDAIKAILKLKDVLQSMPGNQEDVIGSTALQQKNLKRAFEAHAKMMEEAAEKELEIKAAAAEHERMVTVIGKQMEAMQSAIQEVSAFCTK